MINNYIKAARLRTLPLSVSGIIVGSFLSVPHNLFNWVICVLAILTTIGFQVLSNFANDYGDGIKGTDDNREGEERMVASGAISPKQMKFAMMVTTIITLVIALLLIYVAFGKENFEYSVLFFLLGIASIAAAIKYTVGKSAYGYSGLGDFFVFIFFGLLSVVGSCFLFTKDINLQIFLPAISIGLLSAAVLNLNNMRDQIEDKRNNKNTLVVKLGSQKAKIYHYCLIIGALISAITYVQLNYQSPFQYLFLIAFIPLFLNIKIVAKNIIFSELDGELKKVALSTFLFAILFGLAQVL
ncbi:1,4-dihydroxy-2-naphthoate octaprenyltransferase [Lutibacter sp. Hel_I_33_5]|uniref:1,4-dihydroxy-2-naphthoate octaprenyltransferase n=1 Tax=Lutibacter sp. Hel_I_33_5 TaxID=1566289 RepID=UPI0011AA91DE|nr:1,4-dihydroxy-2-naphthoate octaprenyltransferase [Lutibacter sp. Hel_I_33_5]